MRRLVLLLVIVTMGSLAIAQKAKSASGADDAAQLKDIENKWNDALLKNDAAYVDSVTAPEWSMIDENAAVSDKATGLNRLRAGTTKLESSTVTDLKARVYGNAAVVTAAYTEKGTLNGKPFQHSGMFTDTFVKRNGKWLAVATHLSIRPMK